MSCDKLNINTVSFTYIKAVEWNGRHQVEQKPALDVVEGYLAGAQDHLALLVHVSRAKVE